MQIITSGKGLVLSSSFRSKIESDISSRIAKFFPNAVSVHVVVSKDGHDYHTDIMINDGTGRDITKGSSTDHDIHHSFDIAASRIEKQLRRYHDKLKDWGKKVPISEYRAVKRTVPAISENYEESLEEDYFESTNKAIVSEQQIEVERLSVAEAVMRMDLLGMQAMLFINNSTNTVGMVYRKGENIAWVETTLKT